MVLPGSRTDVISKLQTDILRLQGFKTSASSTVDLGLEPLKKAFPNDSFPLGAVHEFITEKIEDIASTTGFIAGLLSTLSASHGIYAWISSSRKLFPPALKLFGVQPDRCIFIDLEKETDVLWAIEEALKCDALTAVVGETKGLSFMASRRLQLAVEKSRVTGFILRNTHRKAETTACVSRWKITPLASTPIDNLPGIGVPTWRVEILRMRNGKAGVWNIQWKSGKFLTEELEHQPKMELAKKAG